MSSILIIALWVVMPLVALFIFIYATTDNLRKRQFLGLGIEDVVPFLVPVNLQALENLTDPCQEDYLSHRRTKAEFRAIQRRRVCESIEYLRRMNHNARVLRRLGVSQLLSGNPMLEGLGQELISAGVNVRLYTFLALVMLYSWQIVGLRPWPFIAVPRLTELRSLLNSDLIPAYTLLKENATRFTLLKASGFHDAVTQSL
jgi:hypothetical protein